MILGVISMMIDLFAQGFVGLDLDLDVCHRVEDCDRDEVRFEV